MRRLPVLQLHDGLERLHREREDLARAVAVAGADAVGVGDAQCVEHERLLEVALGVGAAEVDLVDALGDGLLALEVVALDEDQHVVAHGERVADDVRLLVGLVAPGAAGVLPRARVELEDLAAAQVGVVGVRALDDRVEVASVGGGGHRLEPAARAHARGLARLQVGVLPATWRPSSAYGFSSSVPSASKCSRNGPNSSPTQNVPSFAFTTDSMSKSRAGEQALGGALVRRSGSRARRCGRCTR